MPALASTINQTAKFMIRCQIWYILLRKPYTYIQLLLSTIHINRDLIKYVSTRYIMQENENVSWKSCPKIPNSKWQHPCWLACFSIKLGYTSDEERWPTSILMTCFTCVWVNKCVCVWVWEGEMDGERKWERHREKEREIVCLWQFLALALSKRLVRTTDTALYYGRGRWERFWTQERILGSSLQRVLQWRK